MVLLVYILSREYSKKDQIMLSMQDSEVAVFVSCNPFYSTKALY